MLKALLYRLKDSHYMAAVQRVAGPGGQDVVTLAEAPLEVQSYEHNYICGIYDNG